MVTTSMPPVGWSAHRSITICGVWGCSRMDFLGSLRHRIDFGTPVTNTGRAIAGGGGIDIPISTRFSLRAIQADFINTQTFSASQNNLRFSTGLVFRWGAVKKNRSARKMPSP